ncbi:root meristem growth factor 10 [Gastrolobium bilobum]|uniref:root meristem growth factor 10 n=1 Tax=Gastrolobium bilobum TaxID=150636 RepID=UPI002AAF307A|nr:root meristem growth factor 10 [Gastrolobium bilobum]
MSIAYLLLLFLCISLHACNARHLSPLDKKLEKKSHISVKSDEKNGFDSSPKELNEGDNKKMETRFVADSEKLKKRSSTNQRVLKAKGKASGASQSESLVSVSWRVPHKKPSQKHPGFNLDYAPPKTHPPHHN